MVTIQKADLLETKGLLLHGCNAQGVMGSGVAKLIKQRWPQVFEEYAAFCRSTTVQQRLGQVIFTKSVQGVVIGNCITQEIYGKDGAKYASYDLVDATMERVGKYMNDHGIKSVHLPKIGCGLGGLHWPAVQAILEHRLGHFDVVVCVLE